MSITNRPYVGTWQLSNRELVQHTPDTLVYINGDTTLPGCTKCNGRIDIQQFITEVSVEAGTDPGSASASFSLSIPVHHTESFARDAKQLLVPGLEVHIYQRGYFPVRGMYRGLAERPLRGDIDVSGRSLRKESVSHQFHEHGEEPVSQRVVGFKSWKRKTAPTQIVIHESVTTSVDTTEKILQRRGLGVHQLVGPQGDAYQYFDPSERAVGHAHSENVEGVNNRSVGVEVVNGYYPQYARDQEVIETEWADKTRSGPQQGKRMYAVPSMAQMESLWRMTYDTSTRTGIPLLFPAVSNDTIYRFGSIGVEGASSPGIIAHHNIPGGHGDGAFPLLYMVIRERGYSTGEAYQLAIDLSQQGQVVTLPARRSAGSSPGEVAVSSRNPINDVVQEEHGHEDHDHEEARYEGIESEEDEPFEVDVGESLLEEYGLADSDIENLLSYPYYHTFHGVVIQASNSWAGGASTYSVTCVSMLHFWQYHTISTNASIFGARPDNSKLKTSMVGHNFTGMHPYQIMYTLHHDMVGAAGGVGWALSDKTNQTALGGDESLFSLNIKYWEKRFAQRMVKLRMHGASGELYSAAQSTYLGRNSTDSLKQLIRHRFSDPSSRKGRAKELMEDAISLGLFNKRKLEAMLFARSTGGEPGDRFELNLAEMEAFVTNISNWGQLSLFEAAYESKLDIAQKVMEVTGFEFYQDVDGDFVFKPPMYNLDTSSSRIYRLEDIDIISISTDEKEPQATYATVKGSQFANIQGTGTENEWGVRGQYIDYRLVAQYGWRPAQYETAFFNDPKSMFYSAMNRLDILNAPSQSAQVTIPLRPEIRPGYPVYIPHLDAFYYCNGISHSYSVGGQCTTTLQLIAKRAKFYAPGDPTREGIDAIDLENVILPPRPLEVRSADGHPRLSGFPNVVMALDPNAINPLFWAVGANIERLDDPVVLKNILRIGSQKGVGILNDEGDGTYTMTIPSHENSSKTVRFFVGDSSSEGVDLLQAGRAYVQQQESVRLRVEAEKETLARLQSDVADLTARISREVHDSTLERLREERRLKRGELAQALQDVEGVKEAVESEQSRTGVSELQYLIKSIGEKFFLVGESKIPETHSLLDMLSNKKATLSNGSQPGEYRYYSASHPDVRHQGQDIVEYSNPPDGAAAVIKRRNSFLDPEWQGTTVQGYLRTSLAPFGAAAEAQLGEMRPARGIRVLTNNPTKPSGEVVPTSQIREMMFSVQDVTQTQDITSSLSSDKLFLGSHVRASLSKLFRKALRGLMTDQSIVQVFGGVWGGIYGDLVNAVLAGKRAVEEDVPSPTNLPSFPSSVALSPTVKLPSSVALSQFRLEDTEGTVEIGASKSTAHALMERVADILAAEAERKTAQFRLSWASQLKPFEALTVEKVMSGFDSVLAARWGVPIGRVGISQRQHKGASKHKIHSPVFPVSDGRGYEVVGSYRYGRDVDIEPGGAWDSLHAQDPLQFLDKKTVEDIVDVVVSGKSLTVENEIEVNGGQRVKVKSVLSGSDAVSNVERRALSQLRQNLTDRQILDLGLATPTDKDPNMLQLNLSNWFSDGAKEGVHKLPVSNVAFTLADLDDQREGRVCACRAAEAGVLLDAFRGGEFLEVTVDNVTQFSQDLTRAKSLPWSVRQDQLRGKS